MSVLANERIERRNGVPLDTLYGVQGGSIPELVHVELLDPDGTLGGRFESDDLKVILGILRAQLKRLKLKQE